MQTHWNQYLRAVFGYKQIKFWEHISSFSIISLDSQNSQEKSLSQVRKFFYRNVRHFIKITKNIKTRTVHFNRSRIKVRCEVNVCVCVCVCKCIFMILFSTTFFSCSQRLASRPRWPLISETLTQIMLYVLLCLNLCHLTSSGRDQYVDTSSEKEIL